MMRSVSPVLAFPRLALPVVAALALGALGCCKLLDDLTSGAGSAPTEDARFTFTWEHSGKKYTDVWYHRGKTCSEADYPANVQSLREKSRSFMCLKKICGPSKKASCSFDCDAAIKLADTKCENVPAKSKGGGDGDD